MNYVAALRSDGEALAVAATGRLDVPVPSCPGWSMADLVVHTGKVHRDKAQVVRRGGTERFTRADSPAPGPDDLLDWYREGLSDLADLLAAKDPEEPAWSWTGDHRVAFWQRRMAHETAVHRWDAQDAVGIADPIAPADLAADGVGEMLEVWAPAQLQDGPYDGPAGSLHVHATDAPGEWLVDLAPPALRVRHEHGKADAALRGAASDLDLVLWERLPADRVAVFGDAALLASFLQWIDRS